MASARPSLARFNLVAGLVHLGQAAAVFALANDLSLPISAGFLTDDPVAIRGPVEPEVVFDLRIGWAVGLFLLLAAFDHLLVAFGPVRRIYEVNLDRRRNPIRWIEYSVSAAIMMVLIAAFSGVWDLSGVIGLFALTTSMILFGWLMEKHQEPGSPDWTAFWAGTFAGAVPWVVVGIYLFGGAESPPGFVYAIFAIEFVLYSSFAVNQVLQYRQVGRWRDYVFGEWAYVVLSLAAKSLLAWLIFANVLRS